MFPVPSLWHTRLFKVCSHYLTTGRLYRHTDLCTVLQIYDIPFPISFPSLCVWAVLCLESPSSSFTFLLPTHFSGLNSFSQQSNHCTWHIIGSLKVFFGWLHKVLTYTWLMRWLYQMEFQVRVTCQFQVAPAVPSLF